MLNSETAGDLAARYRHALSGSRALHAYARALLAGASAHDSWRLDPFAPVMQRALGPYKWDVDNRRYVDYWMGHGSLLLGHAPPAVVAALQDQVANGTHLGGLHRLVLDWAEHVVRLIPSAEQVRFTSSGTEATLLAIRVARAHTGRPVVLRVDGHYHGWHDEALAGTMSARAGGLHPAAEEHVEIVDGDPGLVEARLVDRDVACLIIEPGGGSCGSLPWQPEVLRALRKITHAHGALLVFDEVVSGFRYSPGGVQSLAGVLPDLTVLGKVLCGGCPGGALAGSTAVMRAFGSGHARADGAMARVVHAGTFNANPLAAAAGVATLGMIGDGSHQTAAEEAAAALVHGVNACAARHGVDVRMFSVSSIVHLVAGALSAKVPAAPSPDCFVLLQKHTARLQRLRLALLVFGLDMHPSHGWVSSAHDADTIAESVAAFDRAFHTLTNDPIFAAGDDFHERDVRARRAVES